MSEKIILRIFSKAGRSRVEMGANQSLYDFKTELGSRLSLPVNSIKLFSDDACKKAIAGRDTAALKTLFKNGDIVHVGNQDAALASVAQAAP